MVGGYELEFGVPLAVIAVEEIRVDFGVVVVAAIVVVFFGWMEENDCGGFCWMDGTLVVAVRVVVLAALVTLLIPPPPPLFWKLRANCDARKAFCLACSISVYST